MLQLPITIVIVTGIIIITVIVTVVLGFTDSEQGVFRTSFKRIDIVVQEMEAEHSRRKKNIIKIIIITETKF